MLYLIMKRFLFLFLWPALLFPQADSIFTKDGSVIIGTITLVNDQSIFYNNKKEPSGYLPLSKVARFSMDEKESKTLNVIEDTSSFNTVVMVNDVDINKLKIKYCELAGLHTLVFGYRFRIGIDYGQGLTFNPSTQIKDQTGKIISFRSMVDALNFMT